MSELTREQYVESEYKKWEEKFEIPFELDFEIKALFELQHQFINTPDEHIKTKTDLINVIGRLKRDLNLKPIKKFNDKDKLKVLIIADNLSIKKEYEEFLSQILEGNIETQYLRNSKSDFVTNTHKITIAVENELLRGWRADLVYRLQEDRNSLYKAFTNTKLYTTDGYDIDKGRPIE